MQICLIFIELRLYNHRILINLVNLLENLRVRCMALDLSAELSQVCQKELTRCQLPLVETLQNVMYKAAVAGKEHIFALLLPANVPQIPFISAGTE